MAVGQLGDIGCLTRLYWEYMKWIVCLDLQKELYIEKVYPSSTTAAQCDLIVPHNTRYKETNPVPPCVILFVGLVDEMIKLVIQSPTALNNWTKIKI